MLKTVGGSPEKAQNAMLAGCTAVLNLQAIARHSQGASRMNVGVFESGTGRNKYLSRTCIYS